MNDILNAIGKTPTIKLNNIYCKCEFLNPSGSIKDRIAYAMIKDALEKNKKIKNPVFVEASSGNTGISVAFVAAAFGYNAIIFLPKDTAILKKKMILSYGASIIETDDVKSSLDAAVEFSKKEDYFIHLNQFENEMNYEAQKLMAYEIWFSIFKKELMKCDILPIVNKETAIVCGIGTGGTLLSLLDKFPNAEFFIVSQQKISPNEKNIEGIQDGFVPQLLKRHAPNCFFIEQPVSYMEAYMSMQYLNNCGLNVGLSSGAYFKVASEISKRYKRVITIFADNRVRYL